MEYTVNNQQFSESKGTISIALVHEALSRAQDKGYDIQQILHDAEIP
ncbi:MAG: AraC family transcriptional regulator, partial [Acinetobacter sp.]|nr:AraC family transcriptional regulator [Acinetobacter sp.]